MALLTYSYILIQYYIRKYEFYILNIGKNIKCRTFLKTQHLMINLFVLYTVV